MKISIITILALCTAATAYAGQRSTTDLFDLTIDAAGTVTSVRYNSLDVANGKTGGFSYSTVVDSTQPFTDFTGTIDELTPGVTKFTSGTQDDMFVYAEFTEASDHIEVDGYIEHTNPPGEKAVWLQFKLPIEATGWTFWESINKTTAVPGDSQLYPVPSVTGPHAGFAMSINPDSPIAYRTGADGEGLWLKFAIGLSDQTDNFPNQGHFKFRIYQVDKDFGIRAALQRYYDWHPNLYSMNEDRIDFLQGWGGQWHRSDKYYPVRDWDLPHMNDEHLVYENFKGHAKDLVDTDVTDDATLLALVAANTSFNMTELASEGQEHFLTSRHFKNDYTETYWIDADAPDASVTYPHNVNPLLLQDQAGPPDVRGLYMLNRAKDYVTNNFQVSNGGGPYTGNDKITGLHYDTVGAWSQHPNFRKEHWAYTNYPLTFDELGLVNLPGQWGFVDYFKDLYTWMNAQGSKVIVEAAGIKNMGGGVGGKGNHGDKDKHGRWFLGPYVHSGWNEGGDKVHTELDNFDYVRTVLGRKTYRVTTGNLPKHDPLYLPTIDFVKQVLSQNVAMGIPPMMYRRYFAEPGHPFYDVNYSKYHTRDLALWAQYRPVALETRKAGWQPLTNATTDAPGDVRVERFGTGSPQYFSVWAPVDGNFYGVLPTTGNVKVLIDMTANGLDPYNYAVTEEIDGTALVDTIKGGILEIDVPMEELWTRMLKITANDLDTQDRPFFLTDPFSKPTAYEGAPYTQTIAGDVYDQDRSDPGYAYSFVSGNPAWLSIDVNTGVITGTPPGASAGNYDIVVQVNDPSAGSAQATLQLTVAPSSANLTIGTLHDSYIEPLSPCNTNGSSNQLKTTLGCEVGYLMFEVPDNGLNVTGATFRINSNTNSNTSEIRAVACNSWTECTLNANNAPPTSCIIGASQTVCSSGDWGCWDVSGYVTNTGFWSFAIMDTTGTTERWKTKEACSGLIPELQLTYCGVSNNSPAFLSDPVTKAGGTQGISYADNIVIGAASDVWDIDIPSDSLSFVKVSGPDWLSIDAGGNLSGTPLTVCYTGLNEFDIVVFDLDGYSDTAKLNICVTLVDGTAPTTPAGLIATPTDSQVALDWSDSTDASAPVLYSVFRSTTSGGPYTLLDDTLTTSDYTDTPLTNGITYYYVVTATDPYLNTSALSAEANALPLDAVNPANPTGLAAQRSDSSVALAWDTNPDSDIAYYEIYRSTTSGVYSYGSPVATGITQLDHIDTGLSNGVTYYYVIRAFDTSGNNSGDSNETSVVPAPIIAGTLFAYDGIDYTLGNDIQGEGSCADPGWNSSWNTYCGWETPLSTVSTCNTLNYTDAFGNVLNTEGSKISTDGRTLTWRDLDTTCFGCTVYVSFLHEQNSDVEIYTFIGGVSNTVSCGRRFSDVIDLVTNVDVTTTGNDYQGKPVNTNCKYAALYDGDSGFCASNYQEYPNNYFLDDNAQLVVARFDFNGAPCGGDDNVDIYFNPPLGVEPPAADLTFSCVNLGFNKFRFAKENNTSDYYFDEFRTGDSYSAVTPYNFPPPAPSNLIVAGATSTSVDLDWDDSLEPTHGSYKVYRSTTDGGPYSVLAVGVTNSDYTDNTVSNGTTYYYVVTDVTTIPKESGFSNQITVTPGDVTPPAAPTNLSALAGYNMVSLDWDDNNTEPDFVGYSLYRGTVSSGPYTKIAENITSSDYNDFTPANGVTYYYVVRAVDTYALESADSNEANATPVLVTPGTLTVYEGFDYTVGLNNLTAEGTGGTGFSGNWGKHCTWVDGSVAAGSLGYTDVLGRELDTTGHKAQLYKSVSYRDIPNQTCGTVYVSVLAQSNDLACYTMIAGVSHNETNNRKYNDRVDMISNGINNNSSFNGDGPHANFNADYDGKNTVDCTVYPYPCAVDANTHLVVMRVDYGPGACDDNISLYFDPQTLGIEPGAADVAFCGVDADFDIIRMGGGNDGGAFNFDEWRVGSTFADVTPFGFPPESPASLVATPGDGTVNLDWNDNTEPDFDTYNVYRSLYLGGGYIQIASSVAVSTYDDNTVVNGTTYYYVVSAVDTDTEESYYSNQAEATPTGESADYNSWDALHSVSPDTRSDDSDGDGYSNEFEYYFGTDPNSGVNPEMPAAGIDLNAPTVTFTRRINAPSVTYTVETSPDLATWNTRTEGGGATDYTVTSGPTDVGGGRETLTIRYNTDFASLPGNKIFFRIVATE